MGFLKKNKNKKQEELKNFGVQVTYKDPNTGNIHIASHGRYDDGNGNSGIINTYRTYNPNNGGNNSLSDNSRTNPQIGRED